jgi:hypothetical protein
MWRERKYNRPYVYFEPLHGYKEKIAAWAKLVIREEYSLDDFILIVLPPRPELVDWHKLGVGTPDNSLQDKELENDTIAL